MTELTIQGLAAELLELDSPGQDTYVAQFRFRPVDTHCFTYQVEVSRTAFVSENGYSANPEAFLEDARRRVEALLAAGRYEDLILARYITRWMPPIAPAEALRKHSSYYDGA